MRYASGCLAAILAFHVLAAGSAAQVEQELDATGKPRTAAKADGVHDFVKLFDLRKFDAPPESEKVEDLPTRLMVKVPMNVADAWTFYAKLLADKDWKKSGEPESERVTEQYAQGAFRKQGHHLSLFISPFGDKPDEVHVMINHHGNVDTRKLPPPDRGTPFYESQTSTIHVTEATVAETAASCREKLSAVGWQEYGPAFTHTAEDVDNVALMFRRAGTELSAFIGVAPAQDGKTTVQYGVTALAAELPWPKDSREVEFDPHRPYLACIAPHSLEATVAFYRKELAPLDWVNKSDLDKIGSDEAMLYFDDAENNRLLVSLTSASPEETTVKCEHFTAEYLAQVETRRTAPVPREEPMPDEGKEIAAKSIPLPEGAERVDYDADAEEIIFTSKLSVEELVKFYRDNLDLETWKEDRNFTVATAFAGSMDFETEDDASLSFTLVNIGLGDGTNVTISCDGLAWDEEPESD